MASPRIEGAKVAVLATNGFEQSELEQPVAALTAAGATVHVIAPKGPEIQGWEHHDKGRSTAVDVELAKAKAGDYDALMLPGGVINPDALRLEKKAIAFIGEFVKAGKPIGAICHAPWLLIEADIATGHKLTSYHSIRKDMENAGGLWEDSEVVTDQGLVTSRNPNDLPAFCDKLIEEIAEGRHTKRAA